MTPKSGVMFLKNSPLCRGHVSEKGGGMFLKNTPSSGVMILINHMDEFEVWPIRIPLFAFSSGAI